MASLSSKLKTALGRKNVSNSLTVPKFLRSFHSNSISGIENDDADDDIYHLVTETPQKPNLEDEPPRTNVYQDLRKTEFKAFGTIFSTAAEGSSLFEKVYRRNPNDSIIEYTKLLSGICRMNEYVQPIVLFKKLDRGNMYTMTVVMKCYDGLRYTKRGGFSVLARALKFGEEPDLATYTTLLNGLIRQGLGWEAAVFGQKVIASKLCEPTMLFYSMYVNALCSISECDRALSLLSALERKNKSPNVVMYGNVIDGLCKDLKVEQAMELFRTLDCKGIVPDTPVYNSLIRGFSLKSKWKEMQSLLNEMKSKNVRDVKTMTIVIDSYCKAGMVDEAQKLVKEMECRGPRPSLVTYNTLIDGFITRGQIEEARALFDSLNSKGFTPTVVTYNSIMSYYCKHMKMREAMSLFDQMSQEGVSPSLITYNILLFGLFKIKNLRKAVVFFNGMTEIDISTWRILLHGLCSLGLLDQAGWVLQAFPFPDVQGYNILIQGAAKSGRRDLTSELLVGMRQRGLKPDTRTLNILLRSYFVAGDAESAIQVFEASEELRGPDSYHIFLEGLINSSHHAHLVPQVLQLIKDKNIAIKLPIPPTATKLLGLDGSEK